MRLERVEALLGEHLGVARHRHRDVDHRAALELAREHGISLELMHRVATLSSGGFDALPHNGAVITLLGICGLSHRQSYADIGMVAVVIPVAALVVVIILGSMFGGF